MSLCDAKKKKCVICSFSRVSKCNDLGWSGMGGERTLELACIRGLFASSFTPSTSRITINTNNNCPQPHAKRCWGPSDRRAPWVRVERLMAIKETPTRCVDTTPTSPFHCEPCRGNYSLENLFHNKQCAHLTAPTSIAGKSNITSECKWQTLAAGNVNSRALARLHCGVEVSTELSTCNHGTLHGSFVTSLFVPPFSFPPLWVQTASAVQ